MSEEAASFAAAKVFREMADRIERNNSSDFGGAIVITPPGGVGGNIELLMLDAGGNPAQFWSTVKTRIELILAELSDQQRTAQGYGGRR